MANFIAPRIRKAQALARDLHATQKRRGTQIPYIEHLMGVAKLVREAGGSEDQIIAALLHDSLEDGKGRLTRKDIADRFGRVVEKIVVGCTDSDPDDPGGEKEAWLPRKRKYLDHLCELEDPDVLLVVAADKLYNACSILQDLRVVGLSVFERFKGKQEGTLWYYSEVVKCLAGKECVAGLFSDLMVTVEALQRECAVLERLGVDNG